MFLPVPARAAVLAADGFVVLGEAEDGATGLEAAHALKPDFVLVDIGLPDIEGFEVARAMAVNGPPPWVVLTSSRETQFVLAVLANVALLFIWGAGLRQLAGACRDGENVMPVLIDAVKDGRVTTLTVVATKGLALVESILEINIFGLRDSAKIKKQIIDLNDPEFQTSVDTLLSQNREVLPRDKGEGE